MSVSIDLIESFLWRVNNCFPIPLSQKVDLVLFSKKLHDKATLCVEYNDGEIVSMVAGYADNVVERTGYISLVATLPQVRRQGLARKQLLKFIDICKQKELEKIHLYTTHSNIAAQNMYFEIGFVKYDCENESRPDDLHLIYYIERDN